MTTWKPPLDFATLDWITPEAESVIAEHARVSTRNPVRPEYKKLLKYCIREGHWSIFEQACASFEIITSRDISAQIIRHRSFSFQELSQRYSDPTDILAEASEVCWDFEIRLQDKENRQNSIEIAETDEYIETAALFKDRIHDLHLETIDLYKDMLEAGVAKECARRILPMYTPTRIHMQGSIRSWIFYVGLRSAAGTQKEHKLIAQSIGRILRTQLPTVVEAVVEVATDYKDRSLFGWFSV